MAGSPKDAYGMLRYPLPYAHRSTLKVGDPAPDARLVQLDGQNHFHIRERTSKPWVWYWKLYLTSLPPPGWRHRKNLRRLQEQANSSTIYVRGAHPMDVRLHLPLGKDDVC
jgi:hypothetical protein